MKERLLLSFTFLLFMVSDNAAQEKSRLRFGDVSVKDFAGRVYSIDSNANAVVLADIGSSRIEGNMKGGFSLVFKQYRRVHILNKNGYDIADVSVPLYTNGSAEEELEKLKAVTYNLENGKLTETRLDLKTGVFKDKLDKNWMVKKFTFPGLKEGSIIEFEYTKTSDFLQNLEPWEFQGEYPCLWSEYNLTLPSFFNYVFITQGYKKYDIIDKKERSEGFKVMDTRGAGASELISFNAPVNDYRWVIRNVPALKEEKYTSTLGNHKAKIEFQLSSVRGPMGYQEYMGSWEQLAEVQLNSEFFGDPLNRDNGWLNDISGPLVKGISSRMEKARKIYAYVRDNFTCTGHNQRAMDQNLRSVVKTRNGNVAEINLLLTTMLRHENIDADPVLLSTRAHGYTYSLYPILSKFNYVICRTIIDGKTFFMDATEPRMGFGFLPLRCYNGHARVINKSADPVELDPDSITEKKLTSIFIISNEKGNWTGTVQQTPGYHESCGLRTSIIEKGREELWNDIKKDFGVNIEIRDAHVDSVEKYDYPLGIEYDFEIKEEKGDIIYLNPMFGEGYKENPFKSAERFYPVEMPNALDETYNLQIEVPTGYELDELPAQAIVKLNDEEDGIFEYRISQSGGTVSLRSRLQIKRTYFLPEEYQMLREFYNLVVKKHSEQIVFKKKK